MAAYQKTTKSSATRKNQRKKISATLSSTSRGSAKKRLSQKEQLLKRKRQVRRNWFLIGFILLTAGIFTCFLLFSGTPRPGELTKSVLQYEDQVKKYCKEYDISEYSDVILAMMQQESAGKGTDVMQCSESPFNTQYSNEPGSITDVDYSIQVGVETFAYCLGEAQCTSVNDMDKLKLALQEYNFGNAYATWAAENYGGYSPENAQEYSDKMKAQLGWTTYGDPEYVPHVLRYYNK
ncbi:lysozyme family protein [Robinsoniella sp. KNHs210]|uniref:lysozyme family protein n=1 Tax=Robinsoniella sp. KNHs210 TaxID=1469950 RepID=UPI000480093D|nr:lysozyme family protein [Robinsoniella sp. KNHs210]